MTDIYQVSNYTPCQIGLVKGERGENGANGANGLNGKDGKDGKDGLRGLSGSDGKSVYQLALDNGFVGSFYDYEATLRGKDGENNYQLAVKNGFDGDYDAWVEFTTANIGDAAVNSILGGFVTIDSFELGATITQRNQALRHAADGKLYRWAGDLPKIVPANSTPTSSGGIAVNAWLEVSDTILRQELSSDVIEGLGALMVSGSTINTPTIASLLSIPTNKLKDNQVAYVVEYEAGSGVGGGEFRWDSSSIADIDNGIVFGDVNETGRWVRVSQGERTKDAWYAPTPVTDGARFITNSTNKNISYSKDNSFYKRLLFKIEKPFAEIKQYYPNIGTNTQKCFIEWDRGIFWMTFFGVSPDNRMIIAAVDIVAGSLLTVTAVPSVSTCFEIIKDGAGRKLYVHQNGSLRYIDVTTLPPIGVDSVATVAAGLENVYYTCTYYNKRWYSFEKTTREEVSVSVVKVYRLDGTLERGFAVPQLIADYGTNRKYASKHQSIRLINGEVVFAVGAGSRYEKLLDDGGVYTAANRQAYYQGIIRYSPQNNQQISSLVDPLAYKDKFGFDELVEVQDVTVLAGGGLATVVNDDTYVYVIEEFANSADINSVNLSNYQSILPNVYNIPFNQIIQPSINFGSNNYKPNKLIDIYTLDEVATWRDIVNKMVQYGVKEATVVLTAEIVLGYWFGDNAINITGRGLLTIRLRGNADIFIDYTNYYSPELSKNKRFKISGFFYFDDTNASGLRKGVNLMIERYDTATKQMLYSTDFADPAWEGLPFYTGT